MLLFSTYVLASEPEHYIHPIGNKDVVNEFFELYIKKSLDEVKKYYQENLTTLERFNVLIYEDKNAYKKHFRKNVPNEDFVGFAYDRGKF